MLLLSFIIPPPFISSSLPSVAHSPCLNPFCCFSVSLDLRRISGDIGHWLLSLDLSEIVSTFLFYQTKLHTGFQYGDTFLRSNLAVVICSNEIIFGNTGTLGHVVLLPNASCEGAIFSIEVY